MKFETKRFLREKFNSAKELCERLEFFALPQPKIAQAQKWFDRGSVPGAWLPLLLAVLELEGRGIAVRDYMGERNARQVAE